MIEGCGNNNVGETSMAAFSVWMHLRMLLLIFYQNNQRSGMELMPIIDFDYYQVERSRQILAFRCLRPSIGWKTLLRAVAQ